MKTVKRGLSLSLNIATGAAWKTENFTAAVLKGSTVKVNIYMKRAR
jgi:hypothetical protein